MHTWKTLTLPPSLTQLLLTLPFLQAVPTLVFWEVRRRDYAENMAHHLATIGLVIYSYQVK